MKIELMKQERMGVEGKGILRSLQNDTLPLIDLLIRESIQNSLDATKKDAKSTKVDVGVSDFEVTLLANHLEGVTDLLKSNYNKCEKAIYISDKNTIGLIGDVKEKKGNIYNLIYTIQRNQEQSGAGGSWGLGKTSYFRAGNGIVIYYSRIKLNDGSYEERLAGSLIEDSTKKNRLLQNDRGIAWWGEKENSYDNEFASTYPLTDSNEIYNILKIFKIKPYLGEETGTTIIIPFISEDKLLPKYEDEKRKRNWWEDDLQAAIEISIQKWYSPRIFNLDYEGSYLIPSINGKILELSDFQPFFKKIHDLYLAGLTKKNDKDIIVNEIQLKRRGIDSHNGIVGWLAHNSYSRENLEMTPPDNVVHPLEYFSYENKEELENTNAKIVVYARKPGMIVEYDINSNWTKNVAPLEDKFMVSFFIPNSRGKLYSKFIEPGIITLEDYLRKTEKSDHAKWEDITLNNINITIINRIMKNVIKTLQDNYNEQNGDSHQSKASVLGKKIGDMLLPKHGVSGKSAIKPTQLGDPSTNSKVNKRRAYIKVLEVNVNEEHDLIVTFNLILLKNLSANISVDLITGTKNYNEENWKKDMGLQAKYPFLIKEVFIQKINSNKINSESSKLIDERLSIYFTSFSKSSFKVLNNLEHEKIEVLGTLLLKINDKLMQPSLVISEVKENV